MLTCSGCMRHCLHSIIGDSALLTTSSRPLLTSSLNRRPLRRNHSTSYERSLAGRERYGDSTKATPAQRSPPEKEKSRGSSRGTFESRHSALEKRQDEKKPGASARLIQRKQWLDSRGIRPPSKKELKQSTSDARIQQHLKYLNDPVKLAHFVNKTLNSNGDFDFVRELVRAASKNSLHIVSWNHLVGYQMSQGKMNAAISTYNEMKKRAQIPDAYTYTTIFTGCASHKDSKSALPKVLAIYNSMFAENAKVKPNTIHMNCVLKMCAKAMDMDALYAVAAQFTEKGLRSPNNLSFSIILNAIRFHAAGSMRSLLSPMEKRQNRRAAIANSRQIWMDVVERWRKGDMWIDEELVASMGRLLLIGEEQDWDDVFSLVQQTMNIPRQIPKLGSPARQRMDPASQGKIDCDTEAIQEQQPPIAAEDGAVTPAARFEDITVPIAKAEGIAMYAKPGPNTLSLLMQACLELGLKAPAASYWRIFTKSLLITPDSDNYHSYLRVLRLARASSDVISLLRDMPTQDMSAKTFRIAMPSCSRDKRNPNVFSNAGKVLDIMQMALSEPEIPVLIEYLDLAMVAPALEDGGKHKPSTVSAEPPSKIAQGKQILRALDRLNPSFLNLKAMLHFGDKNDTMANAHTRSILKLEVLRLIRRMIAAYDYLMNNAMVPREMYLDLTKQRSKLAAYVTRSQRESQTPRSDGSLSKNLAEDEKRRRTSKPLGAEEIATAKKHFHAALEKADHERVGLRAGRAGF